LERSTWTCHPDAGALKESIVTISDIAEYVEESQVEAERINKVMAVRDVLVGKMLDGYELVAPSRKYVKEVCMGGVGRMRDANLSPSVRTSRTPSPPCELVCASFLAGAQYPYSVVYVLSSIAWCRRPCKLCPIRSETK
jgi:hypothetical protein